MASPVSKALKMSADIMQVANLSAKAIVPTKGSVAAAGYGLYSAYDYTITARRKVMAKTEIQVKVPHGTYGRSAPRSALPGNTTLTLVRGWWTRTTGET